jgi:N-methylhydantoinase B/oxoprolinase/acetone carboxylase alpha subunit
MALTKAARLEILGLQLSAVAEQMGAVLRRAAYSPNIKERADFSAAVFTPNGELLAQAEHIPVHLGSMPASARAAIERLGDSISPGCHVILNDPYLGGTHLNDITLVTPSYKGKTLIGWVATRAHHSDVGGKNPGSIPPDATEIFQEGLRIPPVLYSEQIAELVCANSRTPRERRGDLEAQVGANRLGAAELARFDPEMFEEICDYGERRMRAAMSVLQPGTYVFVDRLDSSGASEDQRDPVAIALKLVVERDRLVFDFTASDRQAKGSINAVRAVTVSAVEFALRSVLDPDLPRNAGVMRPVEIVTEPGSVVDAEEPAATGAGNVEASQRIADVCFGALAQAAPGRVGAASQGTMNNVLVGGRGWTYYETLAGGQGARPDRDGMSAVHTGMTNTENTPIEALEREFPMLVEQYSIRENSGGKGRFRGGDGLVRAIRFLEEATVSLVTERRVSAPWGLAGGQPGATGRNLLRKANSGTVVGLADKAVISVNRGDVLIVETPGGGGYGTP